MTKIKKWDLFFLGLAKYISTASKDPNTKVGAIIIDGNKRIISTGFNGYATRVKDVDLDNRKLKLQKIIHAEMNAILFAKQDLTGCGLITYPMMPCSSCSSIIIQSGIKRCVFPKATKEQLGRWKESFSIAKKQFGEAGVILKEYKYD